MFFNLKTKSNGHRQIDFLGFKILSYKPHVNHKKKFILLHERYKKLHNNLLINIKNNKKIKIAFLIAIPSMFPARPLLRLLDNDDLFEVSVVAIPDFSFGQKKAQEYMNKTEEEFSNRISFFKSTSVMGDENDGINLREIADIVFYPFPYEGFTHPKYELKEIIACDILPAHINYTFPDNKYNESFLSSSLYSSFWRVFTETALTFDEIKKCSKINGKNVVLTGYCKMDDLRLTDSLKRRKTIMIAPHHSIEGGYNATMHLANFLRYSDFFLKLPTMYPNLNFIFRPHPALFPCLSQDKFWGEEKVNRYISKLKDIPNLTYSFGNDYFEDFERSDALIQDCCSFLVEYFYTQKPQCYMLKDVSSISRYFSELGRRCLEHCYLAYEEKDIINFIDNVFLKQNDSTRDKRFNFAKSEIMLNYPNVAKKIREHLLEK